MFTGYQNMIPFVSEWEKAGILPSSLYEQCATAGLLMPMGAGSKIPQDWASKYPIIGGVPFEKWDGFHDFIVHDEVTRVGGIG